MNQTEKIHNTVWLDMNQKIASFHCVDGFDRKEFTCHEFLLHFVQALQGNGYRFQ